MRPHFVELVGEKSAKGLVFLPKGGDTCPRLVIEAKLLGCDIVTNDGDSNAACAQTTGADVQRRE